MDERLAPFLKYYSETLHVTADYVHTLVQEVDNPFSTVELIQDKVAHRLNADEILQTMRRLKSDLQEQQKEQKEHTKTTTKPSTHSRDSTPVDILSLPEIQAVLQKRFDQLHKLAELIAIVKACDTLPRLRDVLKTLLVALKDLFLSKTEQQILLTNWNSAIDRAQLAARAHDVAVTDHSKLHFDYQKEGNSDASANSSGSGGGGNGVVMDPAAVLVAAAGNAGKRTSTPPGKPPSPRSSFDTTSSPKQAKAAAAAAAATSAASALSAAWLSREKPVLTSRSLSSSNVISSAVVGGGTASPRRSAARIDDTTAGVLSSSPARSSPTLSKPLTGVGSSNATHGFTGPSAASASSATSATSATASSAAVAAKSKIFAFHRFLTDLTTPGHPTYATLLNLSERVRDPSVTVRSLTSQLIDHLEFEQLRREFIEYQHDLMIRGGSEELVAAGTGVGTSSNATSSTSTGPGADIGHTTTWTPQTKLILRKRFQAIDTLLSSHRRSFDGTSGVGGGSHVTKDSVQQEIELMLHTWEGLRFTQEELDIMMGSTPSSQRKKQQQQQQEQQEQQQQQLLQQQQQYQQQRRSLALTPTTASSMGSLNTTQQTVTTPGTSRRSLTPNSARSVDVTGALLASSSSHRAPSSSPPRTSDPPSKRASGKLMRKSMGGMTNADIAAANTSRLMAHLGENANLGSMTTTTSTVMRRNRGREDDEDFRLSRRIMMGLVVLGILVFVGCLTTYIVRYIMQPHSTDTWDVLLFIGFGLSILLIIVFSYILSVRVRGNRHTDSVMQTNMSVNTRVSN